MGTVWLRVYECADRVCVESWKWVLSRQSKIDWKKILLNINMVAVFAGVFLFFTKIRLPQILNQTFGSVGSMIGPASMMVTGS